jgi:hypothetical protein
MGSCHVRKRKLRERSRSAARPVAGVNSQLVCSIASHPTTGDVPRSVSPSQTISTFSYDLPRQAHGFKGLLMVEIRLPAPDQTVTHRSHDREPLIDGNPASLPSPDDPPKRGLWCSVPARRTAAGPVAILLRPRVPGAGEHSRSRAAMFSRIPACSRLFQTMNVSGDSKHGRRSHASRRNVCEIAGGSAFGAPAARFKRAASPYERRTLQQA